MNIGITMNEEKVYTIQEKVNGKISFEYLPCINYAMVLNDAKTCYSLCVDNEDDVIWKHIEFSISGSYVDSSSVSFESIPAKKHIVVNSICIKPRIDTLIGLTEGIKTEFVLSMKVASDIVFEQTFPLELMAFDQWTGTGITPELTAAFVTPNVSFIPRVIKNASELLGSITGASAMDEYQTKNPNRVRAQVAAIYDALRSEHISYTTIPASFENFGQRIRFADKVLVDRLGTCMDLSLLMASCMEAVGINPIIVFFKGHAYVGAWLVDSFYPNVIGDDKAFLLKSCADGINEMVLLETTSLTSDDTISFEDAVTSAMTRLNADDDFDFFLDIKRCRFERIRPLPIKYKYDGGIDIDSDFKALEEVTEVNKLSRYDIVTDIDEEKSNTTRQDIWERKLLDISLRNNLVNTKLGKKVIPLLSFSIDKLEDKMQDGNAFSIKPCPLKGVDVPAGGNLYNSSLYKAQIESFVQEEFKNKRLYSFLTDKALDESLKVIYRTARTSLEENGANALFLAIGILKWYETDISEQPRYAPLLLLPIDMIRRGGNIGYEIRTRDEEIIFNTTLVELLKQKFQIVISGLEPLPLDEHGVDVKRIFAIVRQGLRNQKRWDLQEEAIIGLFSFSKFVMWNDIHSYPEELQNNPIVNSLLQQKLTWDIDDKTIDVAELDAKADPSNYVVPVDVDSSQLEAIIDSGEGKSFILYGPPGTGKSQTITNMIANALYQNKRVLFVAEKKAALDVVESRLARIGLSPFCLELHSNKVTKSHFLKQMKEVLEVGRKAQNPRYQKVSDELYERRKELLSYVCALHKKRKSGFSLYDCISSALGVHGECIKLEHDFIMSLTPERLDSLCQRIADLDILFKVSGHPFEHPLSGLTPKSDDINIEKTKELLLRHKRAYENVKPSSQHLQEALNIKLQPISEDFMWFAKLCSYVKNTPLLTKDLLSIVVDETKFAETKQAIDNGLLCCQHKNKILDSYDEHILNVDAFQLKSEWITVQEKWFIPRFFARRKYVSRLKVYNTDITPSDIPELLESLNTYESLIKKCKNDTISLRVFGSLATEGKEQWANMLAALKNAKEIDSLLKRKNVSAFMDSYLFISDLKGMDNVEKWNAFKNMFATDLDCIIENADVIQVTDRDLKESVEMVHPIGEDPSKYITRWVNNISNLRDWYRWTKIKSQLEADNLTPIIQHIENNHVSGIEASNILRKSSCNRLAYLFISWEAQLRMFNGLLFEDIINKYKALTEEFKQLSIEHLQYELAKRVPNQATKTIANSEIGILKRNIANGGRGTSIRGIIDQIPNLLPKLCPCMLMSPISVAQFTNISQKFDLVIFDEASQMPTSEAVGAIARAKSLVVVGDPKQMPPTSFFTSSQTSEEEADIDDMESILDDCITLSFPSHRLSWHYRSKHESLIAFSNTNYYASGLFTFPSTDDRERKVKLVKVDGCYDKGKSRCNKSEATAIVKEVIRRLSDQELSQRSIGIISFSKAQQNLIEDELTDELFKHPELKAKAYDCEEPIFIKNLENVQGDERDIILFSVGYGPDKNGNVSMNFGPLNNKGGERRLNVAVSRARYEMVIFSTLRPEQIDLRRTNAIGVAGLKHFLEYADNGTLSYELTQDQTDATTPINEEIANALRARGFNVDTNVGRSKFKVDVAVIDKSNPSQYALGILCDGKSYFETKTTRDREIVQPSVLQMLNWRIMRVWSVEWFSNKEKVIERIIDEIHNPKSITQKKDEQSLPTKEVHEATEVEHKINADPYSKEYEFADPKSIKSDGTVDFMLANRKIAKDQIETIITAEQPITNSYLYKRMVQLWGLTRVTVRVQEFVDDLIKDYYHDKDGFDLSIVLWKSKEASKKYKFYRLNNGKRDIKDYPMIEVKNAVMYALEQQVSVPKEDLMRYVPQVMGFTRLGSNLNVVIETAIDDLLDDGKIEEQNGKLVIISSH